MYFRKNTPQGMKACNPLPPTHDVDVDKGVSEDIIRRTANALSYDVPLVAIKATWWEGLSEYECWLAYCAARVCLNQVGA